ncbi:hypothetical protein E4T39_06193 [Aureobasidium subglaciale]|nr:hypothetical protein E4T39_06193 [Aureobasidium subglaciale]
MSSSSPTNNVIKSYPQGTIELALHSDLASIHDLITTAYTPYIARLEGKKPAPMTADYASLVTDSSLYVLRPAAAPSIIAGCISLALTEGGDALEINNLAVSPAAQGKGYGKVFMAFSEEFAKDNGITKLELYTNVKMVENLALYRKLGYQELGRWSEDGFERVFFRKEV